MPEEPTALRLPPPPSSTRVILYALADDSETIETIAARKEAEAALDAVLADEPSWAGPIGVVELELGAAEN